MYILYRQIQDISHKNIYTTMLLKLHQQINLTRLGYQSFDSKIQKIAKASNDTYLLHLKLSPNTDDHYHQLVHIDRHATILWTHIFKQETVLIVDTVNQSKILLVTNQVGKQVNSYNRYTDSQYCIKMYDTQSEYKCVKTKITRSPCYRQEVNFIKEFLISNCGEMICFLEGSKQKNGKVTYHHLFNIETLQPICHPLQYFCEVSKFCIFREQNLGCFGFISNKKISQSQYLLNNLSFNQIDDKKVSKRQYQSSLQFQVSQKIQEVQYMPQYYEITFLLTQCEFQGIKFKEYRYKYSILQASASNSAVFQTLIVKNQTQLILVIGEIDINRKRRRFEQIDNKNKEELHPYKYNFFTIKKYENRVCLKHIGFFLRQELTQMNECPIQFYCIQEKILVILKNVASTLPPIKSCQLKWLEQNHKSDKMTLKKSEVIDYQNSRIFGFKRSNSLQLVSEENNKLNIQFLRYVEPKDVYMHFLLHLNEDFDDDLLFDVIDMIA